jgi:pantoate--beta-alanine ligase
VLPEIARSPYASRVAPVIVSTPEQFRAACDTARANTQRPVGFVPTMGALHEGHLALVREAKRRVPFVAVSIFVNPTQFGPNEDLARYPRDLGGDVAKLATVGADLVFAPDAAAMYPKGEQMRVRPGALAESLCGPFRPGHFEGVATVVAKLFALVGPSVAVFGKKDYQQFAILRRLAIDLFFPVEIVGHPIVREPDGVAMSSRNAYLSAADRARALCLSRGLDAAWKAFAAGERDAAVLRRAARARVEAGADSIDYVDVTDPDSLVPVPEGARTGTRALVAIACRIGPTRLIDNVVLGDDPSPLEGRG